MSDKHTDKAVTTIVTTNSQDGEYKTFWQSRSSKELNDEDIRQINENLTGFFSVLSQWKQNAMRAHRKSL